MKQFRVIVESVLYATCVR